MKITVLYYSYDLRPVTDNELQKINGRIDDKIVRRRQQQHEQEQKSKQSPQQEQQQTTKPAPVRSSSSASTSNPSRPLTNSSAPLSNNEEYSIFRDPPAPTSQPTATRVILISFFINKSLFFVY